MRRFAVGILLAVSLTTSSAGVARASTWAAYISPQSQSVCHGCTMTWTISWAGPSADGLYYVTFYPEYNVDRTHKITFATPNNSMPVAMPGQYPCRGTSYTQMLVVGFKVAGSPYMHGETAYSHASEGGGNPC
jgi:hypothetical protein